MSREPTRERHAALAWADQLGTQRRAAQSLPWQAIGAAIQQHMAHGAGALADPGTESLADQLLPADPLRADACIGHLDIDPHTQEHRPMPAPLPQLIPRPAGARAETPSDSTRRPWARMADAEAAARQAAHADGVREGWRGGWRWGLSQGIAIGALLASIGWAVWLTVSAPQAAPPSARPAESIPLTSRG